MEEKSENGNDVPSIPPTPLPFWQVSLMNNIHVNYFMFCLFV